MHSDYQVRLFKTRGGQLGRRQKKIMEPVADVSDERFPQSSKTWKIYEFWKYVLLGNVLENAKIF